MPLSTFQRSALVALCAALAGCATATPPSKDATILSRKADKLVPGATASKDANALPVLELDGAVRQAEIERQTGDLTAASKTLSQLVLVAPDDPRVLSEYGKTLVALGRSDDALAFLERATQIQPFDWSLYSAQGVAFDQKGQFKQAQESYEHALRLKPGEPAVLSNNALSHMQSGDLDGAERLLLAAAQKGGDYPRISNNLALVQGLKASRTAAEAAQAKAAIPSAPAEAEVAPLPDGAPAIAEAPVPTVPVEPPSIMILVPPVEQAALPAPSSPEMNAAADPEPSPQLPSTAQALASDPTVHMQAVPKDSYAGPVARKRPAAQPRATARKAPDKTVAAEKKAEEPSDSLLRPALVEAAAGQ
jgi:Flp pilus assembly protein TadD